MSTQRQRADRAQPGVSKPLVWLTKGDSGREVSTVAPNWLAATLRGGCNKIFRPGAVGVEVQLHHLCKDTASAATLVGLKRVPEPKPAKE